MPYENNSELPNTVKDTLPVHGQDIYREAFNSAWKEYKNPEKRRGDSGHEQTAHQVAWSAVKREYTKNENNEWVKK